MAPKPALYLTGAIAAGLFSTLSGASITMTSAPGQAVFRQAEAIAQTGVNLPFKLDGKPVYVQRSGTWQEAQLRGYRYSSNTGALYTVQYTRDQSTEQNVPATRIMSLAQAQQQRIAKAVYDVSSPAGLQQMLESHNQWRKRYGLSPLTWSPQLATYAQEWATKLLRENRFEHRRNSPYGENLASASGQQFSPERVVRLWGEEVKDYNYATNSCQAGKMCGHFTQIVWRDTKQVGCGVARSNGKEVWVCNYNPPGNYSGRKPY